MLPLNIDTHRIGRNSPFLWLSSLIISLGKPLIGRNALLECGYSSVRKHRNMFVVDSSLLTTTRILLSLNVPRRYMSVILASGTGIFEASSGSIPASSTTKYGSKSPLRQVRRNSPRYFISLDELANLQWMRPSLHMLVFRDDEFKQNQNASRPGLNRRDPWYAYLCTRNLLSPVSLIPHLSRRKSSLRPVCVRFP